MTTAEKIKQLRRLKKLSQHDLANILQEKYKDYSITRDQIAHWETGIHLPLWPAAKILVHFFRITLDDLFYENKNPVKDKQKNKLRAA